MADSQTAFTSRKRILTDVSGRKIGWNTLRVGLSRRQSRQGVIQIRSGTPDNFNKSHKITPIVTTRTQGPDTKSGLGISGFEAFSFRKGIQSCYGFLKLARWIGWVATEPGHRACASLPPQSATWHQLCNRLASDPISFIAVKTAAWVLRPSRESENHTK
jgi:hypothetical protein